MEVWKRTSINHRPNETMKLLSSIVIFLAVVAASLAYTAQWGTRKSPDRLVYSESVFNATRAGQSIIRDVYFPKNVSFWSTNFSRKLFYFNSFLQGQSVKNITLIRAVDNVTNGTGAYPLLLSGGPGFRYSNIRFNSQRNYGINFRVEYYGN